MAEVLRAYAVATAGYTIYAATMSTWDVLARTIVFLCLMLVMVFLLVGPTENSDPKKPTIFDYALSLLSLACLVFFIFEMEEIAQRITLFDPMTPSYWFFGYALLFLAVEAARRTVGVGLTLIVLVFMAYNLWGHHFDGPLSHGVISYSHFLDITVFTTDGIFGVPVQVTATYAFLFVMFGTLLERSGGGAFFFDVAAAATGRRVGGPAKVAVFSSGLFGMMSGSPTADVVTTGSVTIPIMKRLGYSPTLAGGVEVAASTGGSILPPVMGSAVFIMAEFTGIDYLDIVIAGLVPALLYYAGIFLQVHLRSRRLGLLGLPPEQIPSMWSAFKGGWLFLVPLATLTTALVVRYSPTYVALYGVISVIAVWLVRWSRFSIRDLYDGIAQTTFNMVAVTGACAAAGMVIGGITMTGLAGKVSELLHLLAGPNLGLTLVLSAVMTIILGMGMPTPAAYALAAALIAPTLTGDFGVSLMQAHLFLLYFAVLSAMTPPVAVAAYAAAGIADAQPVAIASVACKFAVAAFFLPFAFVYDPGILLMDSPIWIVMAVLSTTVAVFLISVGSEGFWLQAFGWLPRVLMFAAAVCFLAPQIVTMAIGCVLAALAALMLYRQSSSRSGEAVKSAPADGSV
ncbi:TRAP transporter fused permease subunit [Amorphus sp. 3PC139-8]